jgi:DedD protein
MASPANTEASEVRRRGRQRLIGAIALVAILVVFVPMVLDSEPKAPRGGPTMAIPSKTESPPLPAPPKAEAKAEPKVEAKAEPPAAPAEPAKVATVTPKTDARSAESKALEPPGSKPAAPKAAPPPAAAKAGVESAPKLEGFAVQVGAFRDPAKLDQARQKLAAAKIPHYTERLESKEGAITRLRAGPYPTRDAAEAALATLKRSALDGKVVPLP